MTSETEEARSPHPARVWLADNGWIGDLSSALPTEPDVSDLSCPECDSDDIMMWSGEFVTNLKCGECENHQQVSVREVWGRV